jgi:hypothetical protein
MTTSTYEIRGRGQSWRVYYPNEARLAYPVPVYNREGVYKETLYCGSDDGGMTETHFVGTREEAEEYALYLNPSAQVSVTKKLSPSECLQRARKARRA